MLGENSQSIRPSITQSTRSKFDEVREFLRDIGIEGLVELLGGIYLHLMLPHFWSDTFIGKPHVSIRDTLLGELMLLFGDLPTLIQLLFDRSGYLTQAIATRVIPLCIS